MKRNLILIHPPLWDMYGPPASTPALVGHLRAHGLSADQVDLNQIYFRDRCDELLDAALSDVSDEVAYRDKIPYEHKVVFGATEFTPDLLAAKGIDRAALSFDAYRRNIARWDLPRLNVMDALIHYGYFVRTAGSMNRILSDREALGDDVWRRVEALFREHCLARVLAENPTVVGFSILGEQQLAATIACTHWLRREYGGTIVWGGSDIRYTHDKMQREDAWWRDLPDYICLGEGETALRRLADPERRNGSAKAPQVLVIDDLLALEPGARYEEIPGLASAPFLGGALPVKHYEDVDRLGTYSFDGLDLAGYLMPEPVVPYQASRGCHWGICAFCDHEEGYRRHYRPKTVQRVVDDMEAFRLAHGITHLQFVDEAIEPEWFEAFLDEIEARGLAGVYRWSNYSKISPEATPALLERGFRLGCRMILFGVETFNQRLLKLVKKGILREQIFRQLRDTASAGIRCWIWLISGLPTQTPEELLADVRDLESVFGLVDAASVGRYRISANSDLAREPDTFGIVSFQLDSPMDVVCEHDGRIIDPKELADIFYRQYYPLAIEGSRSHNRYLILQDAIRSERDPRAPVEPRIGRLAVSTADTTTVAAGARNSPGEL